VNSIKDRLLQNIDEIHTTELGYGRISKNIGVKDIDIINWCKSFIRNKNSSAVGKGKNYYITFENITITINAHSLTIITAHRK